MTSRLGKVGLAGVMLGALVGCSSADWLIYGGFLDPSQIGSYHGQDRTLEIRRSISLDDEPGGVAGATDPLPEDTVAQVKEYVIGPGDVVSVRMLDLLQENSQTDHTTAVTEIGEIYLPVLKEWIKAEGYTVRELQYAIQDLIVQRKLVREPEVLVQLVSQRQQTYSAFGQVGRSGSYQIVRPNFRLLEALNATGGFGESFEQIYVYRSMPTPEERVLPEKVSVHPAAETGTSPFDSISPPDQLQPGRTQDRGLQPDPFAPATLSDVSAGSASSAPYVPATQAQSERAASAPASRPATPSSHPTQELIEAIAPTTRQSSQLIGQPELELKPEEPQTGLSTWIFLNGEWVEVRQEPATAPATSRQAESQEIGTPSQTQPQPRNADATQPATRPDNGVDWEALGGDQDFRIIRIPAAPLRNGDPRYNIVIRSGDIIRVPVGEVGVFYLGGNVGRPGTYTLTGREMTLKQAIISAGGLGILAWPERCEIIRRVGKDREKIIQLDLRKIFEYKEPDFYLKADDIVMVGTHVIAQFLASIRNGFRLSYGFGFVYDRNFATIDTLAGQGNPALRRQAELQRRFPGLF